MNAETGVDFNQFSNLIAKYGHNVVRTPIVKTTSNMESDETLTAGTSEVIWVYLARKNAPWFMDKAGLITGGDAIMLAYAGQTINKDDTIAYGGTTYRVQDVIPRDMVGGITAYKACNLFKIE